MFNNTLLTQRRGDAPKVGAFKRRLKQELKELVNGLSLRRCVKQDFSGSDLSN